MLQLTMLCPPLFMRQTLRMAGAPSKPNPVGFGDATETEITVQWDADAALTYRYDFVALTCCIDQLFAVCTN